MTASGAVAEVPRARLRDLARAGLAPLACALVLTCLLSAWVAIGGAGTLTRVRIQVTLAAIPMRGFTTRAIASPGTAATYLTIRNLSDVPDELVSARCPVASRIVLTRQATAANPGPIPGGLLIPARSTLTLSPFGSDLVLIDPTTLADGQSVPLTLVFRQAGVVTVTATVTAPGTP